MSGSRKGLVAPQNTFLDNIIRRCNTQHYSFLLASAKILDYPIVYCNDGFTKLTGFNRVEVMQKGSLCTFMHGENTNKESISSMERAMEKGESEQLEIILYKKNRSQLSLLVRISPIFNDKKCVVLFLITLKDITAFKGPVEEEDYLENVSKFVKLAKAVTRNKQTTQNYPIENGPKANHEYPISMEELMKNGNQKYEEVDNVFDDLPLYKQEAPKTPPHVILHYAPFKTMWDWLILVLVGYNAIVVPLYLTYLFTTSEITKFIIVDSIIDIIFFIDIVLNFHTTFVGPNGEVVSDPVIIRINYFKGWFIVDVLSCLPYDLLTSGQPASDQSSSVFKDIKVARLLRLFRILRRIEMYLEYVAAVLTLMIFAFLILAHWLACIWYKVGINDLQNGVLYGWIPRMYNSSLINRNFESASVSEIVTTNDTLMIYLTSLYYTISLVTTIGFGNVSASTQNEQIMTIFCMLIGALIYAAIFGNVTTIVSEMYANRSRYNEMMKSIKDFLKLHDVKKELCERVIDYVTSTWAVTKGIDPAKVLNYCPKDMKADLCVHLNRMVFNEHPAFRLASDGCLRALAINFTTLHTAPGDLIFHQGESVDQLCFIVSGSLEVIQDDEIVAILGKDDIFGDYSWKDKHISPSAATIRALTYCDLHCIKRDRLQSVLEFHHTFANSFSRNLLLTYNLRQRILFRKLADVKKEKELAERRKNDPPISNLAADHAVRKLLNRFKKSDSTKGANSDHSETRRQSITSIMSDNTPDEEGPKLPDPSPDAPVVKVNKWSGMFGNKNKTAPMPPSSNDSTPEPVPKTDFSFISPGNNLQKVEVKPTNPTPNPPKWNRLINKKTVIEEQTIKEEEEEESSKPTSNLNLKANQSETQFDINKIQNLITTAIENSLEKSTSKMKEETKQIQQEIEKMNNQLNEIIKILSTFSTNSSNRSNQIISDHTSTDPTGSSVGQ